MTDLYVMMMTLQLLQLQSVMSRELNIVEHRRHASKNKNFFATPTAATATAAAAECSRANEPNALTRQMFAYWKYEHGSLFEAII